MRSWRQSGAKRGELFEPKAQWFLFDLNKRKRQEKKINEAYCYMEKVFFKEGFKRVFKSDHVGVVQVTLLKPRLRSRLLVKILIDIGLSKRKRERERINGTAENFFLIDVYRLEILIYQSSKCLKWPTSSSYFVVKIVFPCCAERPGISTIRKPGLTS